MFLKRKFFLCLILVSLQFLFDTSDAMENDSVQQKSMSLQKKTLTGDSPFLLPAINRDAKERVESGSNVQNEIAPVMPVVALQKRTEDECSHGISAEQDPECLVCCIPMTPRDARINTLLPCKKHVYCYACLVRHIQECINNNLQVLCPGFLCDIELNAKILKLVCTRNPKLHSKVKYQQMRRKALCSPESYFFCPHVGCNYIGKSFALPELSAGTDSDVDIEPAPDRDIVIKLRCFSCKKLNLFIKSRDDRYFQLITPESVEDRSKYYHSIKSLIESRCWKLCPQCKVLIAKPWPCPHVTCGMCGKSFCWTCKYDCSSLGHRICTESSIEEEMELFLQSFSKEHSEGAIATISSLRHMKTMKFRDVMRIAMSEVVYITITYFLVTYLFEFIF